MTLEKILRKTIYFSYLALFFITPFLLSIKSAELFEFPKMLFVYFLSILIGASWLGLIGKTGKIVWRKSWLDPVLLAILLTQFISTLLSMQPYTSWYGYYSRFHGGMFSTLSYCLLAFGFVRFAKKSWIKDCLIAALACASIVSLYAIAEHFGIDAKYWVQDVQNRVFSTLGQPNWLAAWLGSLLPIAMYWFLHPPKSFWPTVITLNTSTILASYAITYALTQKTLPISGSAFFIFIFLLTLFNGLIFYHAKKLHQKLEGLKHFNFLLIVILLELAILFTKSRSGILALVLSSIVFGVSYLITQKERVKNNIGKIVVLGFTSVFLLFLIGTEWSPSLAQMTGKSQKQIKSLFYEKKVETIMAHPPDGISQSTDIRRVVWQGAVEVWRHYPLLGAGTETFAYSYYNFRPIEHNNNSEWDFLYNKAHNEYLNFLANNGLLGTSAILLLILATVFLIIKPKWQQFVKFKFAVLFIILLVFLAKPQIVKTAIAKLLIYPPLITPLLVSIGLASVVWFVIVKKSNFKKIEVNPLDVAFLASFASIFVTNFYGFSVVNVGIMFFLIPAFLVVRKELGQKIEIVLWQKNNSKTFTNISLLVISLLALFLIVRIINFYKADEAYNFSKNNLKMGKILEASREIETALTLHPANANYHLQKAVISSQAAFALSYQDASDSAGLVANFNAQAVYSAQNTLLKNPVHILLYKSVAQVYATLGLSDPQYFEFAIQTFKIAQKLSPTDPQLPLNIALLMQQQENYQEAEQYFKKSVELKPNYRQAWFLLAQMYEKQDEVDKAKQVYQFVLDNIDPVDITSLKKMNEFRMKEVGINY
jgi:tetratricopeptide (TPR) repeat protein